jgi:molecular chaperone DnaJ
MLMNHYLLLGLSSDAAEPQIKTAYRRMAKRFHPDTNHGSEAAAELFRQLHEAYRVLTDPALRVVYDAKLAAVEQATRQRKQAQQNAEQAASQRSQPNGDPQQKFNRFLHSLLDAVFEVPPHSAHQTAPRERPPQRDLAEKVRQQPDFNFYYYLALEKKSPPYSCGADGVYRRTKPTRSQPVNRAAAGCSRVPGASLVMVLCCSLWSVFSP